MIIRSEFLLKLAFLLSCALPFVGAGNSKILDCYGAEQFDPDMSHNGQFCSLVSWTTARLYEDSSDFYFNPGTPAGIGEHIVYAQGLYQDYMTTIAKPGPDDDMLEFSLDNRACSQAVQRLACLDAFPECPLTGPMTSAVGYIPPCRLQCEQVNSACSGPGRGELSCESLPTENCIIFSPANYFILEVTGGPYGGLPALYAVLLLIWITIACWWSYRTFVQYKRRCLKICRYAAVVPIAKSMTVIMALSFWTTCAQWQMCSSFLSVVLINFHLVYETCLMQLYLLLARGWTVAAPSEDDPDEQVRYVPLTLGIFYVTSSILLILQQDGLEPSTYVIVLSVLLLAVYAQICHFATLQYKAANRSVESMKSADVPEAIQMPLKYRRVLYLSFLVLVALNFALEVMLQIMLNSQSSFSVTLLVYEVVTLVIIGAVLYIFRPQEMSPFFFMVPTTRLQDDHRRERRPATTLKLVERNSGGEEDEEDPINTDERTRLISDVDILPIVPRLGQEEATATQLIIIREPKAYSIGSRNL